MHLSTSFAAILLALGTSVSATLVGVAPVVVGNGKQLDSGRLKHPKPDGFNGWEIGRRWREQLVHYSTRDWDDLSVWWHMSEEGHNPQAERDVTEALSAEFGEKARLGWRVPDRHRVSLVDGKMKITGYGGLWDMPEEAENPGSWPPWYWNN